MKALAAAVGRHGFLLRGGFHPLPADGVPGDPGTLVMIGNAGPAMWKAFRAACPEPFTPNPLDAWTREVLGGIARDLGATPLFPFDGPPYLPFQRWADAGRRRVPLAHRALDPSHLWPVARLSRRPAVRRAHSPARPGRRRQPVRVLTGKRLELLRHVRRHRTASVRALAKALGRDDSNVHADVQALMAAGLIEAADGGLRADYDAIETRIAV